MSFSFNKTILFGNVGKEPEVVALPSGGNLLKFSLATTRSYKKDDAWKEETTWHSITAFSPSDFMLTNVTKGAKLLVVGRISIDKFEDKEGNKREKAKIILEEICYCNSKPKGEEAKTEDYSTEINKDDLPF